ncbi:hypothetical protein H0I39_17740 [Ottowia beijingensis]|uniref:Uncharacterized protein n=1 Tax=Ottowia beijingensis TaxID=1207057 RepID=A0A853IXY1_9BURK|nr:hypothetical protein [Ottowia beijingensis]NZA03107.1 hypothetical protein [Ottowia beijingensis]
MNKSLVLAALIAAASWLPAARRKSRRPHRHRPLRLQKPPLTLLLPPLPLPTPLRMPLLPLLALP